jgi:hypothetical protein
MSLSVPNLPPSEAMPFRTSLIMLRGVLPRAVRRFADLPPGGGWPVQFRSIAGIHRLPLLLRAPIVDAVSPPRSLPVAEVRDLGQSPFALSLQRWPRSPASQPSAPVGAADRHVRHNCPIMRRVPLELPVRSTEFILSGPPCSRPAGLCSAVSASRSFRRVPAPSPAVLRR